MNEEEEEEEDQEEEETMSQLAPVVEEPPAGRGRLAMPKFASAGAAVPAAAGARAAANKENAGGNWGAAMADSMEDSEALKLVRPSCLPSLAAP